MRVRLTQLDGKLPNLALMKLARWHRERGDDVHFTKRASRDMLEPGYNARKGDAPQLAKGRGIGVHPGPYPTARHRGGQNSSRLPRRTRPQSFALFPDELSRPFLLPVFVDTGRRNLHDLSDHRAALAAV